MRGMGLWTLSPSLIARGMQPEAAIGLPTVEALEREPRAQGLDRLQLIAEGKTTKQIGSLLGISVKTAETHRSRLMDKLEIRDTASLVRYAIRNGLTSL